VRFSDLAGRRVVVWGHGREGRSVAEHLRSLGIPFEVVVPDEVGGEDSSVTYGSDAVAALMTADVAIKSPGIPVVSDLYRLLRDRGTAITSLTDLWMSSNAARTVAVTGSKGKSTTAALLDHVLAATGRHSSLRGNIGVSVLEETDPPADVVVMELSSYQAQSLTVSPRILVVTSLFPEHLTWHGSEEAYYRDKLNAAAHGPDVVIAPYDDERVLTWLHEVAPEVDVLTTGSATVRVDDAGGLVWVDGTRLSVDELPLVGRHQAGNAALAAVAAGRLGVPPVEAAAAIRTFLALPHRMERIPSGDGRTWIDDSLATAPEAVVASLGSLPIGDVAVLVGGADRGLDFGPLTAHLAVNPHVNALLLGPCGRRIHAETGLGTTFDSFAEATAWAGSPANPARTVLLSPGAPSFDEFTDYEERSRAFRAAAAAAR